MKRGRSSDRAASSTTSIAIGAPSASVSTASPPAPRSSRVDDARVDVDDLGARGARDGRRASAPAKFIR